MRPAFDPRPRRGQAVAPTNPWSYQGVWGVREESWTVIAWGLQRLNAAESPIDEALWDPADLPSRFPLRTP
jgi:hypothetical protein